VLLRSLAEVALPDLLHGLEPGWQPGRT